ncbi:hypothetical protein [Actinomadura sp. 21ATH]|uniref:hypothetical protein n=1 Tax=Actinomadura sp. 21ATH TaxID=1735444 RepID=UPI0035C224CC
MTEPDPPHVDVPERREIDRMDAVDVDDRAHRPTEDDEEAVLRGLYGEADSYGVYRREVA